MMNRGDKTGERFLAPPNPCQTGLDHPRHLHPFRHTGWVVGFPLEVDGVGTSSSGVVGCVDRVHGLDVSAYSSGDQMVAKSGQSELFGWIYRTLHDSDDLPGRSHQWSPIVTRIRCDRGEHTGLYFGLAKVATSRSDEV
jgi:hypothetical protein